MDDMANKRTLVVNAHTRNTRISFYQLICDDRCLNTTHPAASAQILASVFAQAAFFYTAEIFTASQNSASQKNRKSLKNWHLSMNPQPLKRHTPS